MVMATSSDGTHLLFQEAIECKPDFFEALFRTHCLAVVVVARPVHAAFQMLREHEQSELVERRSQCRNLSQYVDAVSAIVHHLLKAGNLAGDAGETPLCVVVDLLLHDDMSPTTLQYGLRLPGAEAGDPFRVWKE